MYICVYIRLTGSGFGRYMVGRVTDRISTKCLHSNSMAVFLEIGKL